MSAAVSLPIGMLLSDELGSSEARAPVHHACDGRCGAIAPMCGAVGWSAIPFATSTGATRYLHLCRSCARDPVGAITPKTAPLRLVESGER